MAGYVDLHLHTNFSDGSDTPEEVIARAAALNMAGVAITDHDTTSGLDRGRIAADLAGIAFIPGIEISASHGALDIHVIGLGIEAHNTELIMALDTFRTARSTRVDQILERLHDLGITLPRADVEAQAGASGGVLGRIHIARAIQTNGYTRTVQEAFDKYIRRGRKAYVPRKTLPCAQAIDLIHAANGLAFLAHPGLSNPTNSFIDRMMNLPFDGIEAYHTKHSPGQTTAYLQIAQQRGLLVSGGSDCHGTATKPFPDMGTVQVPYECMKTIQERLNLPCTI